MNYRHPFLDQFMRSVKLLDDAVAELSKGEFGCMLENDQGLSTMPTVDEQAAIREVFERARLAMDAVDSALADEPNITVLKGGAA